ncbi:MAG: carboxypeptidase regulatory-like domain-containing protein, partial [Planctomycetota bacterium]
RVLVRASPLFRFGTEDPLTPFQGGADVRDDGSFEVVHEWDGRTIEVLASAPGCAVTEPVEARPAAGSDEVMVEVSLSRGHDIVGVVVEAESGCPVPGARVTFGGRRRFGFVCWVNGPPPPIVHASTDEAGRFRIRNLPAGRRKLLIEASGRVEATVTVEIPLGDPLRVELEPALRIEGVIRYADEKAPAGVWLRVEPLDQNPDDLESIYRHARLACTSGPGGDFVIRGLAPGRYIVKAKPRRLSYAESDPFLASETAPVRAGDRDALLLLKKGLSITGRVVDDEGEPVYCAEVTASECYYWSDMTDEDGRFEIVGLTEGRYSLGVDAFGFLVAEVPEVEAGKDAGVIRISRGLALAGVLVDEAGRPLPGIELWVRGAGDPKDSGPSTAYGRTDAEGRFLLSGLAPGIYRLSTGPLGPVLLDAERIPAGSGDLRIVGGEGVELAGTVVNEAGRPVADVGVQLFEPPSRAAGWTKTDTVGRFVIRYLHPDRSYRLEVTEPDREPVRLEGVRGGGEPVRVVLRPKR